VRRSVSFDACVAACYNTEGCQFWSHSAAAGLCYLKHRRGAPASDPHFVSGVKNCSTPWAFKGKDSFFEATARRRDVTRLSLTEALRESSTLPLLELFHPTGERSVLQGVPALFGPALVGNATVKWSATRPRFTLWDTLFSAAGHPGEEKPRGSLLRNSPGGSRC